VRWRTTVVLVAVAVCLGVYLLVFERGQPTTAQQEEQRQLLFRLSAGDISQLHVEHDDVDVTLSRGEAGKWRMSEPLAVRADGYVCDQLADGLKSLKWESRLAGASEDPTTLAERGLNEPRATLSFRYKQTKGLSPLSARSKDEDVTLYFGDDTPLGERVYLKVAGRPDLYEVRKSFLTSLVKSVDEFRDDTVLVFAVPDVETLSVRRRGPAGGESQVCVAERADGAVGKARGWSLSQPFATRVRADRDKVEDGLKQLAALRVERFVADGEEDFSQEELARYGLDNPVLKVELTVEGKSLSISFGSSVPDHPDQRYALTSEGPSIYAVKAEAAESLASPALEFRDHQLTAMTADRVQTLTITLAPAAEGAEPETTEIVRKEGAWRVSKPRDIEADAEAVRGLLRDIDTRNVTDFVQDFAEPPEPADLAPYGLAPGDERATIRLLSNTGDEEVLHVGARDEDNQRCYLRRGDEPTVLAVDDDFLDLALRGYLAYRTKKLVEIARYHATRIRIDRPAGALELVKDKNDWKLTSPVEKRAERSAVDDLLFELTPLRAERILNEQAADLTVYGLDEPEYRLEVVVEKEGEEPETTVLSIGKALPEGDRPARLGEEHLVAALPESFIERLDAEFRYRTVLTFDRDRADELTITGVTPAAAAAKVEGTWQLREPAGAQLDQAKVRRLLDALKSLRAERWDTYQATDLAAYGLDEPTLVVAVHVGGLEAVTHTLMFGKETAGGSVFARLQGDPGVFLLPRLVMQKARQSILVESEEEEKPGPAAPSQAEPERKPGEAEQSETEPPTGEAPAD